MVNLPVADVQTTESRMRGSAEGKQSCGIILGVMEHT